MASLLASMPGAVAYGIIWGIMAIGVYITFRILDVADLTVDGSMATGGIVLAVLVKTEQTFILQLLLRLSSVVWRA